MSEWTADDLRIAFDDLLQRTIRCRSDGFSYAELMDGDPERHRSPARLIAAKARFWAEYGNDALARGQIEEARTASGAALLWSAELGEHLARPGDLAKLTRAPGRRGRPAGSGTKADRDARLLAEVEAVQAECGRSRRAAIHAALRRNRLLAAEFSGVSIAGIESALRRAKRGKKDTNSK